MKIINIILLLLFATSVAIAQSYHIDRYVIASGGGVMSSANYSVSGTIGQPIVGISSSANYTLESGFWVGAGAAGGCDYATGDVNWSGNYNGLDITYGVAFLKGGNPPLCEPCIPCPDWHYCGDVNGSCSYNGLDITYGVSYLKGGPALIPCGDCPPDGPAITSASGKTANTTTVENLTPHFHTGDKVEAGK